MKEEFKACFVSVAYKASFELLFHINGHDRMATTKHERSAKSFFAPVLRKIISALLSHENKGGQMKIYKYTALVVVLFCSFLSSDCFAKSYICKFYEHADMGGGYFEDGAGSRNRLETDWNDKVSSVWIENRYKVTIYEHADFSGKKQTLYGERGGTLYNLTDTNFNDVLSSYRIEKVSSDRYKTREKKDRYKDRYREDREQYRRGYCIFYEHADKQGAYFHSDTEKQSSLDIKWNDRISSVWVRNGYALTIYEHAGYRGRKETLHGRKDGALFNLTDMNFNDMISSYRIEKTSYERDKYKTPGKKDRYKDSHWKDWEPHKGNYCTFYKHANKKGAYFHGKTGRHPFVGDSWNDKISSVWVRDGYAVTIYENAGYGGRSETLHGKKAGHYST
ncbi:MAG: hypothetical protein GY749_09330 [Desulfobacteraceae bacterium]|nr:hypothetical protein [Desulfobacteraceae bacterium]